MVNSWFYAERGHKNGPLSEQHFGDLVRAGTITENTMVWHTGMREWKPLSDALLESDDEGRLEPLVTAPPREVPGNFEIASFWTRVLAKLIDSVLLSIPLGLVMAANVSLVMRVATNPGEGVREATGTVLLLNGLLIAGLYVYEVLLVAKRGGTPGKLMLGLRIVKEDGRPIGHGAALGRLTAQGLSSSFFCTGYWIAIFDGEKRTLHDHICRTRVVRMRPVDS